MLVVDSNIIFYRFFYGARTDRVGALWEQDSDWRTEPLAIVELSNVLATYRRANLVSQRDALRYLDAIKSTFSSSMVRAEDRRALEFAMELGITAYDARYIAVAEEMGTRLVTDDTELRKAAPLLTQSIEEALKN